jgi:predicted nucleic acid-binding protein
MYVRSHTYVVPSAGNEPGWRQDLRCRDDGLTSFREEPFRIESSFRAFSEQHSPAPKDWADSHLAAFALVPGLQLVTLDQALGAKSLDAILV